MDSQQWERPSRVASAHTESQARHFTVAFVTLAQAALLLGAAQNAGSRAVARTSMWRRC